MPLWGTTHDAASNKPKWLPDSAGHTYDKTGVYATNRGWETKLPGSDAPEILVAIGGLAGATAAVGLKHPTMSNYRIVTSAAHGSSNNIVFEIAYDERITYTAGSAATLLLTAGAGSNVTATVTHISGTAIATGVSGNVLRFKATSSQATTYDLANDVAMGNRTALKDAISGTNLELASGKLTSAVKTAIGYSQITIA
ncbi:uncharacterized protein METZ01_LOCUS420679 [marine metagenome]|uniref:Uncharacterized protein n=1 Tax=marine metagenome TaxID=408172 RepID=A0A382XB49_9ZZZZ